MRLLIQLSCWHFQFRNVGASFPQKAQGFPTGGGSLAVAESGVGDRPSPAHRFHSWDACLPVGWMISRPLRWPSHPPAIRRHHNLRCLQSWSHGCQCCRDIVSTWKYTYYGSASVRLNQRTTELHGRLKNRQRLRKRKAERSALRDRGPQPEFAVL